MSLSIERTHIGELYVAAFAIITLCVQRWKKMLDASRNGCAFFFIVVCALLYANISRGQFSEVSQQLGISLPQTVGNSAGVSCYDFNHDGWDDLTVATTGNGVRTFLNNNGTFEEQLLFNDVPGTFRAVAWIDFDNDGDADFFGARYISYPVLFRNDGDLQFTDISYTISYPSYEARVYSFSWADYDNDSWLDIYIGTYYLMGEITNWLYHNNGDGTFTEMATLLGVDNGARPTYQSSWFDYDLDNDVDLFVTNDRFFGNQTFRNNGDGTFTDIGAETGTDLVMEAMGIAWSDYDMDGDFDFYLPNTESGSMLMRNTNGVFENVAEQEGIECVASVSWGCLWMDSDNDLDQDLYVVNDSPYNEGQNYFFENENGDFEFEDYGSFEIDDFQSYDAGECDFDQNGFPDIIVTNVWPNTVSIWQNDGGTNNWIKVGLTGTASNRDAIGTTVKVYADDVVLMEQWQCGESFMTQCSQYEIFGCGIASVIDSLEVHWPSGWVDHFFSLDVNQFYSFVEGETMANLSIVNNVSFCSGTSVQLDPGVGLNYLWNDGSQSQILEVEQPGIYDVIISNLFGFEQHYFYEVSEIELQPFSVNVINPSCFNSTDGTIMLETNNQEINEVVWQDGSLGLALENIKGGEYHYTAEFQVGCFVEGNVVVEVPEELSVIIAQDNVCFGESTSPTIDVIGGTGAIVIYWFGVDAENLGEGIYPFSVTDENGCTITNEYQVLSYSEIIPSIEVAPLCFGQTTTATYSAIGGSGNYTFDFDEANPEELVAGSYTMLVTDENFCFASLNFQVEESMQIEVEEIIANALNGNNGSITLNVSGGVMPYSYLWSNMSEESTLSNVGAGSYQCVITDAQGCSIEVEYALIDLNVNESEDNLLIFPNPMENEVNIIGLRDHSWVLNNSLGQELMNGMFLNEMTTIEVNDLSAGIYFLKTKNQVVKLIKK